MILPPDGCIGVWRGRHTLTRGKRLPLINQKIKTHSPSNCVLLGHLHTHRKKLRYLRKGATGHHEIIGALEILLRMDKRTLHNPNRPRKSAVLEVPKELKPKDGTMARGPTRIRLRDSPRPRENQHSR